VEIYHDTVLGDRYRIDSLLGQGGMGAVYLARDLRFRESPVAVKRMLVAEDREDLRRAFQREAMLLYHLRHPALPRVIDFFSHEDSEFLVMEFVPGEDLASMIAHHCAPYPAEDVMPWADMLLDVLSYLHTRTPPVIHRDIKPQNMKLTPDGDIVLLDFGLAKGSVGVQFATTASVAAGTSYYGPPEQLSGQGTDERSDLYSLAATLYTLLTAKLPADASHRSTCLINAEADPLESASVVNPDVPHAVSAVLDQAMRLRKNERPRSAIEMRAALRAALVKAMPSTAELLAPVRSFDTAEGPEVELATPSRETIALSTPPPEQAPAVNSMSTVVSGSATDPSVSQSDVSPAPVGSRWPAALVVGAIAIAIVGAIAIAVMQWSRTPEAGAGVEMAVVPAQTPAPSAEPAAPPLAPMFRVRIERADGSPIAGALPAKTPLRIRVASNVPANVYVLARNPNGTVSVVLSDRNKAEWNVATIRAAAGSEIVLPGKGVPLVVETGKERFVVVVAGKAATLPKALGAEPFVVLGSKDQREIIALVERTANEAEVAAADDWLTLSRALTENEASKAIVAVEVPRP
jgi:serine/threonine protein kinase